MIAAIGGRPLKEVSGVVNGEQVAQVLLEIQQAPQRSRPIWLGSDCDGHRMQRYLRRNWWPRGLGRDEVVHLETEVGVKSNMRRFHIAFVAGVILLVTLGSYSTESLSIVGWGGALLLLLAWLAFAIRTQARQPTTT